MEWIELFPYGVSVSMDRSRPIMLFKSESGVEVLPVWLSPLEVGIALAQDHRVAMNSSPHDLTHLMMSRLGVTLVSCFFTEVRGHHQFVELHFSGSEKLSTLEVRADQAISLCLHEKVRFFANPEVIQGSKVQQLEWSESLSPLEHEDPPYLI